MMARLVPASRHRLSWVATSRRTTCSERCAGVSFGFSRPLGYIGALAVGAAIIMAAPRAVEAALPVSQANQDGAEQGARSSGEPTVTEDAPQLLQPRRARSESEDDLLTSAAHFAQARLYLQRQNDPMALRHFQRAWRFNQQRVALLDQVVALASKLGRNEEAARYAILSAERRPRNPQLLLQLGALLAQQNETSRALSMYEKALELQPDKQRLDAAAVAVRIEMGRLYFINEDFASAARQFADAREGLGDPQVITEEQRKALLAKPAALYQLMAACLMEVGELEAAASLFEQADTYDPNPARLAFHRADIAHRQGNPAEARARLAEYFASKSTVSALEPYRLLEKICAAEHPEPDQSRAALLEELEKQYALDPDNGPLGYFLAQQLLEAGDLAGAAARYTSLLAQQPTADAYQGLATIYLRQPDTKRLLSVLGQVAAATKTLDVLEDATRDLVADPELTNALLADARERCTAGEEAERLAASLAASHVALQAGKLDEFDFFADLAERHAGDEKVEVLEQLGLAAFIAEDATRATSLFQHALRADPPEQEESALQFYLAGAAQYAGETDVALAAAARAADLRSDSPRFASRTPWILYQAKRYDEAIDAYRELMAEHDTTFDVPGVRAVLRETRLVLSNIEVERQQFGEAEEWLAQVLDEFPEDIGALNDLGYLWVDQEKHLERATRMIQRAVAAEPENIAYRDSLGWAYYRLGRFTEAVQELTRAAAGDEPDGVILDHLGDAQLGNRQRRQAVATWRKAQSVFRSTDQNDRADAVAAKIKLHSQD